MATITFTTRAANETVSLPSEEAIERLFADADEWFAFQHRAPETEMELFFASIYDAEKPTINPYATEIEVNDVPMAISIKEEGGIAIRPGEWASGMYEDWEKPGEAEPPADAQAWLESMLTQHVEAVEAALDAVNGIEEVQGNPPDHVDLLYYRSQEHYDRYGRDKGDYAIVNARSREIAAILEAQGIEARFRYPEDDEAGFQRLANTR